MGILSLHNIVVFSQGAVIGLLIMWLIVGGYYLPMIIKVFLKGGSITVRYNEPDSAYVNDVIFRQPDNYVPIALSKHYIIGCIKEDDKTYTIGVVDQRTDKMVQVIYNALMDHKAAEYLAKTYSYNHGIKYKKYYNNLEKRQVT